MLETEFKNEERVYKVQTFGTLQWSKPIEMQSQKRGKSKGLREKENQMA